MQSSLLSAVHLSIVIAHLPPNCARYAVQFVRATLFNLCARYAESVRALHNFCALRTGYIQEMSVLTHGHRNLAEMLAKMFHRERERRLVQS